MAVSARLMMYLAVLPVLAAPSGRLPITFPADMRQLPYTLAAGGSSQDLRPSLPMVLKQKTIAP